jgi:TetR/AcrR family transcriptional regulator, transcriptional repressor for nem operon
MSRPRSHTTNALADRALTRFWAYGYGATSMDDLVRATRVSRHGIYGDFGGKKALFLACFDRYSELIVTPAFAHVERTGATLEDVAAYFEHQIALAEKSGLPGPGCFVVNTATEVAPHDADVLVVVKLHNDRLRAGFANALRNTAPHLVDQEHLDTLAEALLVFATGLWALSRLVSTAEPLRRAVLAELSALRDQLK